MMDSSLSKKREFAKKILDLCDGNRYDEAVIEANNSLVGRSVVYIPCKVNHAYLALMVSEEVPFSLTTDAKGKKEIVYGSLNAALEGRSMADGRPHAAFLVYDTREKIISNYVGRDGKSLAMKLPVEMSVNLRLPNEAESDTSARPRERELREFQAGFVK